MTALNTSKPVLAWDSRSCYDRTVLYCSVIVDCLLKALGKRFMRTFTRITTDSAVNNGLAFICDTGIIFTLPVWSGAEG